MRNRFFALIFENFYYKIAAVILAAAFWYSVQSEEILEVNRRVQVHVSVPDEYVVDGEPVRFKEATLRGPKGLIMSMPEKDLEVRVEIPTDRVGRRTHYINARDLRPSLDRQIKVAIHDPFVTVVVDKKYTKKVNVKVNQQGVPAEGYIIEKAVVEPAKVDITGLKSEILKIEEVVTEPVDVTGLQQTKSIEAEISSASLEKSDVNPKKVSISFLIGEEKINRRFNSIPVEVVGSEYISVANPGFVSIVIQGTPGVLSFVKKEDLRAFVEARNLLPGKHEKHIQVKIPSETVLIETVPQNAIVEISSKKI